MNNRYRKKTKKARRKTYFFLVLFLSAVLLTALTVKRSFKITPKASVADKEKTNNNASSVNSASIKVPYISQYPDYPTGCEAVSAVMLLNYYDLDLSVREFSDSFIDKSLSFYTLDGVYYGPDPEEYFVGDPASSSSYGCYSPVIKRAICSYLNNQQVVIDTGGKSLDYLCEHYVSKGTPALVWASIDMKETCPGSSWSLEDGREFCWIAGEHCLVLTGFDRENYYFNDPIAGSDTAYEKSLVRKRYKELMKQSLVINERVLHNYP